ncbi:hypothetical protein Celaphus_00007228, partial [Cervus elaphus hippelaphus]
MGKDLIGGRHCQWMRNWIVWKHLRDYFPTKVTVHPPRNVLPLPLPYPPSPPHPFPCWSVSPGCLSSHTGAGFGMLVKSAELAPDGNYLLVAHHHGTTSIRTLCNFCTESTGFSHLFLGLRP